MKSNSHEDEKKQRHLKDMVDKVAALLLVFFTIFIIISYVKQSNVFNKKKRLGDKEVKDEILEKERDDF